MPPKPKYTFEEVFNDEFFARLMTGPDEARRQGVEQGMQQGMQQGELLALRNVLGDLLVGDVPAEAGQRIADADSGQLRAWIKSLTAGASPRQVFAEG